MNREPQTSDVCSVPTERTHPRNLYSVPTQGQKKSKEYNRAATTKGTPNLRDEEGNANEVRCGMLFYIIRQVK